MAAAVVAVAVVAAAQAASGRRSPPISSWSLSSNIHRVKLTPCLTASYSRASPFASTALSISDNPQTLLKPAALSAFSEKSRRIHSIREIPGC
jgi:hypothetical protein